jgi:HlyD family secretion protein
MRYRIIWHKKKMKEPESQAVGTASPPRPRKKKVIVISAVLVLIAFVVAMNLRSRREKSVRVTVEKAARHDLTSLVSASGEVKPKKNINISAHVPGRIVKIGVLEGQEVKAGDFLLRLDSAQYEANAERDRALIQANQSQLIQSEARMKMDRNSYNRQKQLFDSKLISQEQLESAKVQSEVSGAEAQAIRHQIQQAQASLKSSLDSLSKTVYNSPIDGIITSLKVEEGEVAVVGTMNNPKGAVTEIGSSAIERLSTTQQESRDFKVKITFQNPPKALKPGLSASADIITAEKKSVLAVPISALVLRESDDPDPKKKEKIEQEGLYVLDAGRAKFVPVTKGIIGGLDIEIASGLKDGQEVIVGPYSALRELKDGVLVKLEEKKKE